MSSSGVRNPSLADRRRRTILREPVTQRADISETCNGRPVFQRATQSLAGTVTPQVAASISLFEAVHCGEKKRCGSGEATNGPGLPRSIEREVVGEGFSRRYRGATLAALPRRRLELLRL